MMASLDENVILTDFAPIRCWGIIGKKNVLIALFDDKHLAETYVQVFGYEKCVKIKIEIED
jgi:hypothetical protein